MCARMHFNGGGHENAAGGRLLVPENVKGIEEVGEYIERVTHIFLNDNEDN
jgi:oligoribonuclease NrnB/cAMP/cGMP phosphodiesterase (DHH superfamily)